MNRWNVTINEPDGKGGRRDHTYTQRGPENEAESREAALRDIVGAQTRKALRSGAPDPKLVIVKIEFAGDDGGTEMSVGIPPGAKPLDLEKFSLKNPDGTPVNSAAEALAQSE